MKSLQILTVAVVVVALPKKVQQLAKQLKKMASKQSLKFANLANIKSVPTVVNLNVAIVASEVITEKTIAAAEPLLPKANYLLAAMK